MRLRLCASAIVLILGCKRETPAPIEIPNDPPAKAKSKADDDGKPRRSKGRCVDGAYEKEAPEASGLDQPAFQTQSAGDGVPPAPYSLVVTTEGAPPGADPDDGAQVVCNRFDAVRACFDAARSRITFHEFVFAHVAVDADGSATGVSKVGDAALEECLKKTMKVTNLPKPTAAGAWVWRFTVLPDASNPIGGGTLDQGSVAKVVRGASSKVTHCYNTALSAGGTPPSGKIAVAFTIEPSGAVTKARKDSGTITDPTLVSCVVGVVSALHFPEPATGAGDVVVPFNLVMSK